jgi:hypothetical protein
MNRIVQACLNMNDIRRAMPTVMRIESYRIFFYAGDRDEPPHVHIERDDKIAKFWLNPVRLQQSGGFNRNEINRLHKLVTINHQSILRAWDDYFSD